jgi:hypothetical protein
MKSNVPDAPTHIPLCDRYHSIANNWKFSAELLKKIRHQLNAKVGAAGVMIAAAGSIGRMEASNQSDMDFIVIGQSIPDVKITHEAAITALNACCLASPKSDGVFSCGSSLSNLLEGVGSADENLGELARRMLLLLESRPVFNDDLYNDVMDKVFERYAGDVRRENHKQFAFLINDLIRYFRSICVNYQSTFWRENEKWPLRNLKLRHSRVVMYAGLLFLLGHASCYSGDDRLTFVRNHLTLTPLERIALVYKECKDDGFFRVAGLYDIFLSSMSDTMQRQRLSALDYENRYSDASFSHLKANSDALIAELLRFLWSQRGSWSDRFFEYLVF